MMFPRTYVKNVLRIYSKKMYVLDKQDKKLGRENH